MRQYLVHAVGASAATGIVPFNAVIHLRDDEAFDAKTLLEAQSHLSEQNNGVEVNILSFQPFETESPKNRDIRLAFGRQVIGNSLQKLKDDRATHLNECGTILPPVDSPLLIEVAPGVLLRASREEHASDRNDLLRFKLEHDGFYVGRPRWTHP